jgi:hypothetical protein
MCCGGERDDELHVMCCPAYSHPRNKYMYVNLEEVSVDSRLKHAMNDDGCTNAADAHHFWSRFANYLLAINEIRDANDSSKRCQEAGYVPPEGTSQQG